MPANPYEAPQLPFNSAPQKSNEYRPCPFCQFQGADAVSFTWWGGVVGPKMFTHVKCRQCRKCFNGKSGKSNAIAITIYQLVGVAIFAVLGFLYFFARF